MRNQQQIDAINKLREAGARLILTPEEADNALLHAAQQGDTVAVIDMLRLDANIKVTNEVSSNAQMLAEQNNHTETVAAMLNWERERDQIASLLKAQN